MTKPEIIVPVLNGEQHLATLLESLSKQTIDYYSVTIADNGSTDGSMAVAEKFNDNLNLKIIDASRKQGKAFALNEAVEKSSSNHLIFIDQDDAVNDSYVEAMTGALERNPLVAATMDVDYLNTTYEIQPRYIPYDQRLGQFAIKTAAGGTIGVTQEAFYDIGGFNEDFNYSTNDVEFCWRAHIKGYDLKLVRNAMLFYRLRDTIIKNFRQGLEYGAGNYHIAQLHPEIRGDQATSKQLFIGTTALVNEFITSPPNRARAANQIGKNIGQTHEKLRTFFN